MKFIKPVFLAISLILPSLSFAADENHKAGEKLYQINCAVCHGNNGGMDMTKRIAPPIAAVRMHYINTYSDQDSFVQAISSWVEKQDESKSMMLGAIRKFNIMPPITISKENAEKIAFYIYSGDIEKPEGFKQHIKEQHGKNGIRKMHGQAKEACSNKGKEIEHLETRKIMKMEKRHGNKHGMRAIMLQQLNLSPQQQLDFQVLMQVKESRILPVKKQIHQLNRNIRQLATSSPNYKSRIFSLANEKANLVRRLVIEKGEMRMKIESLLTAEQQARFKQLKQQRRLIRKHQMQNY